MIFLPVEMFYYIIKITTKSCSIIYFILSFVHVFLQLKGRFPKNYFGYIDQAVSN